MRQYQSSGEGPRPILVYDGDCGFCALWIRYWQKLTGDSVDYAPFQSAAERFPHIPLEEFQRSVQLVLPSGEVLSGAKAVFRSLGEARGGKHWLWWLYCHFPGFAPVSEAVYNFIASHRRTLSKLCSR